MPINIIMEKIFNLLIYKKNFILKESKNSAKFAGKSLSICYSMHYLRDFLLLIFYLLPNPLKYQISQNMAYTLLLPAG